MCLSNCAAYQKLKHYCRKSHRADYSWFTLQIKDKEEREAFEAIELDRVKKRVEVVCALLIILVLLGLAPLKASEDSLIRAANTWGDVILATLSMTILGRMKKSVHHYSLIVIIVCRAGWLFAQIFLTTNGVLSFQDAANLYSWGNMMKNVMIPASLLLLTRFKHFICVVVPVSFIAQVALSASAQVMIENQITEECAEAYFQNFKVSTMVLRDIGAYIMFSMGVYSHNEALVDRFISYKKSDLQQKRFT